MRREVLELLSGGTIGGAAIDLPPIVPTFSGSGATANSNSRRGSTNSISTTAAATGIQRQQRLTTSGSNPTKASSSAHTVVKEGSTTTSSAQNKRTGTKWIWAPFASSARNDGALFYHWVKSHVEYPGKAATRGVPVYYYQVVRQYGSTPFFFCFWNLS
jgi:hypothetical protein